MKFPHINTKSPIFLPSMILGLIIAISILVPNIIWKNLLKDSSQVATAFTTNTSGNWNSNVTWGVNLGGLIQLNRPFGVAFSSHGELYIADHQNTRNVVLNANGVASTTFPSFFNSAQVCNRDIAISPAGYVYVPDSCNNRVVVYNLDGTASTSFSIPLGGPEKMAINTLGEIYIAAANPGRIIVLNSDGTASTTFGTGILSNPKGIAVATSGDMYVYDVSDDRVVVLKPDGSYLANYNGFLPGGAGEVGISVSNSGYVYVTDFTHHQIVVLNPDGTASTTLNGSTFAPINPNGVRVLSTGEIYISDDLGRIVILNANGTASTSYNGLATPAGYVQQAGVDFPGAGNNVTISTGTVTLTQDESAANLTLASGGTLNLNGHTLSVSGDWTNTGGTLINNGGTVQFVGGVQNINGVNTFENLTKVATTTSSLLFDPTGTTTITGNFILTGSPTALISVGPTHLTPPVYLSKFGTGGSGDGQFNSPYGIAFDSLGNIYVSDQSSARIQKFDSAGNFLAKVGTSGIGAGQFCHPRDIVVDSLDNIYVTDGCNRVEKFTSSLVFVSQFGSTTPASGSGNGEFNQPWGIAIDSTDHLYVMDQSNTRVQKFDTNGNYISQFGTAGSGNGQFSGGTRGIGIDLSGNIYIADGGNNRIQKFNSAGVYQSQFGSGGIGPGLFCSPHHVTFDLSGNIYVSDFCNRIQELTSSGAYLTDIGTAGSGNGQISNPYAISVRPNNNIYVVDSGNNRIQVFSPAQNSYFNIIASGTTTFSYLSVFNSINFSAQFDCLSGCVDQGGNTNWQFPPVYGGGGSGSSNSSAPSMPVSVATTTVPVATTTTPTATTTPIVATTTKPIVPPVVKPVVPTKPVPPTPPTLPIVPTIPTVPTTPTTPTAVTQNPGTAPVQSQPSSNFVSDVIGNITQTYAQTVVVLSEAVKTVGTVVKSPVGSVATKIVATTGVVVGSLVSVSSIAFATPITFSEVGLIPTRVLGLLLGALGIRRKNRPWGTVYDSVTKRPLDPAYVTLIDTITGKEVATAITDLDGRFSFLTMPGTYKIVAAKTNYSFPSTKMSGHVFDELYNDLYFGNEIIIASVGEIVTKNIPMDAQNFDWNEFAKNKTNINTFIKGTDVAWAKISKEVFIFGFIISLIALFFAPAPYNIIITSFYTVAYGFNYFVFRAKKSGSLKEKTTGLPLSFAVVKIFREGMLDTPILKKIADKEGKYYALLPKGNYTIQVDKKNDDGSYTQIYTSNMITVENGIMNQNIEI